MNDIRPPKQRKPVVQPLRPALPPPPPSAPTLRLDAPEAPVLLPAKKKRRVLCWVLLGILGLIIAFVLSVVVWYKLALRPVDAQDTTRERVKITEGMTPAEIGSLLEGKGLVRNKYAFDMYTRLSGTRSKLQAGSYSLSPSETMQAVVDNIVSGKVDQFSITFLPGATIDEDKQVLVKAGYGANVIDAAFNKQYDNPLFATKPPGADLEGYVYGETYSFDSDATVEKILTTTFNEYYSVIQKYDLVNGFKNQGLSLFQGITLASIVQREVSSSSDSRQVAQVFLKRLQAGMPLGSDVTYHYAAKKLGVAPSPTLDSPYNTRINVGLPPGPIASPGLVALQAVANPAAGDYLYFLSGDDNKTYFANTAEEHQKNIDEHCKIKCSTS